MANGILDKIKGLFGSKPKDDPVTAGHDWKGKPPEEVSEADEVRSQEEMKETFGRGDQDRSERSGDELKAGGTAVYEQVANDPGPAPRRDVGPATAPSGDQGGMRGEVELPAADVHSSIGTDDNRASPSMSEVDRRAMATLAEDEVGSPTPTEGLGLDDGPSVRRPTDLNGMR
jgi:hypothetical protein